MCLSLQFWSTFSPKFIITWLNCAFGPFSNWIFIFDPYSTVSKWTKSATALKAHRLMRQTDFGKTHPDLLLGLDAVSRKRSMSSPEIHSFCPQSSALDELSINWSLPCHKILEWRIESVFQKSVWQFSNSGWCKNTTDKDPKQSLFSHRRSS